MWLFRGQKKIWVNLVFCRSECCDMQSMSDDVGCYQSGAFNIIAMFVATR